MKVERAAMVLVAIAGLAMTASAQDSVSTNATGDALDPYDNTNQCKNYQADLAPRHGTWPGTRFGVVPLSKSSKIDATFRNILISAQHVSQDSIISNGGNTYSRWHGYDLGGALVDTHGVNASENLLPNFPDVTSPAGSIQLAGAFSEFSGDHDGGIANVIEYDPACPNRLLVRRRVGAVTLDMLGGTSSGNIALGSIDANGNMYTRNDGFGAATPVFTGDNIYRIRSLDRDCSVINQIGVVDDASDRLVIDDAVVHTTPGNIPQSAAGNAAGTYGGVNFDANFITNDSNAAPSTNQGAGFRPGTSSSRGCVGSSIHTFPAFGPGSAATFSLITENGATGDKDTVSVWGVAPNGSVTGAFSYTLNYTNITNGCDGTSWDTGLGASGSQATFGHYASGVAFNGGNGQIAVGRDGATGDVLVAGILYDDSASGFADDPLNAIVLRRIDPVTGAALGNDWELVAHVNEATAGATGTNTPIHGDFGNDGAAFSGDPGEFDGILDLNPLSPTYDAPIGEILPLFDVTGGAPLGPPISSPAFDGMGNIYFTSAVGLNKYDSVNGTIFVDTDSALLKAHYDPACGWRLELLLELGSTTKGRNSTYDYQIQFFGVADSNSVSSGSFWSNNVTSENWNKTDTAYLNSQGIGSADNRALGGLLLSCSITYDNDRDGIFDDSLGVDQDYNVALWVGYRPCLADVTTQGAPAGDPLFGVPDELISGADINYYVNLWINSDDKADITTQGAGAGDVLFDIPDQLVSASDINRFVNAWINGCD